MKSRLLVIIALCLLAGPARSADWSGCADQLDRLRRASSDAADVAERVKSASEEYEECRRFPETYDLMGDGCRNKASDYQGEANSLESELSTVESRVRSVEYSCGVDFSPNRALSAPSQSDPASRLCELYRSYKGKLPIGTIVDTCSRSLPEAQCRACLEK